MELWIRSQNKNVLQKTNALFITNTDKNIFSIIDNANMTKYGTYSTKERALEVLDEIENILLPNIKLITRNYTDEELKECSIKNLVTPPVEDVKIQEFSTYVYQMPKD